MRDLGTGSGRAGKNEVAGAKLSVDGLPCCSASRSRSHSWRRGCADE